jgi:hypothetical protein
MKVSKKLFGGLLILILTGLAACAPVVSIDTMVHLKAGEAWSIEMLVTFLKEDADLNQANIEQTLSQTVEGLVVQGVEANWTREDERGASGSAVYVVHLSGQGYELLNRSILQQPGAFSVQAERNHRQILISMAPQDMFSSVKTIRYTIQGGQVLSTNGIAFDARTVYWINPKGMMEANLAEPEGTNWLAYGLVALGVVFLGVSIFGLTSLPKYNKEPSVDDTQPNRVPASRTVFCENCRSEIPSQAIYCPNCGKQRVVPK